jgi:SOS-response transcriptional repressor LexA
MSPSRNLTRQKAVLLPSSASRRAAAPVDEDRAASLARRRSTSPEGVNAGKHATRTGRARSVLLSLRATLRRERGGVPVIGTIAAGEPIHAFEDYTTDPPRARTGRHGRGGILQVKESR